MGPERKQAIIVGTRGLKMAWIIAGFGLIALVMISSDGEHFPWVNLLGLGVFFAILLLARSAWKGR